MIKINVEIKSINILQSIDVYPHQKGTNIVNLILNKLNFDNETRQGLKSILLVDNTQVDVNKTIAALDIEQYSQIEIKLTKQIQVDCHHQYLGQISIEVDAFESVNVYKRQLIQNLIKIKTCEITITNLQNGVQLNRDSWAKYGIVKNIAVGLSVSKLQKITFNQETKQIRIDLFQPIAKAINSFQTQNQIDEFLIFKFNSQPILPDEIFENQKISLDQIWQAEIVQNVTYQISSQQEGILEIIVNENTEIIEMIRTIRQKFKIGNTIPLYLNYKLTNCPIDLNNTVKQEQIPSHSILNLIKEPSDDKINIILVDKKNQNKQIERVAISSTLQELDILINFDQKTQIRYYIDQQIKQRNQSIIQLDLKSESIIEYEITQQLEDQAENNQIAQVKVDELYEPSEDEIKNIRIRFQNKYTNNTKQIEIQTSEVVLVGLKEVIKNEPIQDPKYYNVYFNNKKIDVKSGFDQLNIVQDSILIYFTEYIIVKVFQDQNCFEQIVDQNLSITQIEQDVKKEQKLDQQLILQCIPFEKKNMSLKQFLYENKDFRFEFESKKAVTGNCTIPQVKQVDFQILVEEFGANIQVSITQDESCHAICEKIKRKCQLPRNQVIELYIGDLKILQSYTVQQLTNLLDQSGKKMKATFITYLELYFEMDNGMERKSVNAQLEEKLQEVAIKNNIQGDKFTFNNQILEPKHLIKNLPIFDKSVIKYSTAQLQICFENLRTGEFEMIYVLPDETLQGLSDRRGVKIIRCFYGGQSLDLSTKISNIQFKDDRKITYEQQIALHEPSDCVPQIQNIQSVVKFSVIFGQRKLIYNAHPSATIFQIKQKVYSELIEGQRIDIQRLIMRFEDRIQDDQKTLSSFGNAEIVLQLEQDQYDSAF